MIVFLADLVIGLLLVLVVLALLGATDLVVGLLLVLVAVALLGAIVFGIVAFMDKWRKR